MKLQRSVLLFLTLIFIGLPGFAQVPRQVKVIVDDANIRVKPALEAEILDIAAKGTVFNVVEKAGPWYTIMFSLDQAGRPVYGYIHESMVSPLEETEQKPQAVEVPKEPELPTKSKKERQTEQVQKEAKPAKKVLSGTSLKFGFGEDRWIASLGEDVAIQRNFALGFELQPYYKNDSETDLTVLEMNVFVNVKVGFRFSFVSLYGGGGIGPNLSFATAKIEGESSTQFKTKLAYHVLAGTALNLGPIALIFEYQMIRISDPLIDPDPWAHFFLFGLKF